MGDHREQFVDLTTPLPASRDRATEVTAWLQRTGWTTDTIIDDEVFPAAESYAAGPRAYAQIPGLEGATIGVVAAETIDDAVWYLGDGTGPADCPRCRTSVGERFWDAMNTWSAQQVEPVLTCGSCRYTAAAGEWDLSGAVAVGSLAVIEDLWHGNYSYDRAVSALLTELRTGVGGRWAYVHHHL